jgi:putative endonuclease
MNYGVYILFSKKYNRLYIGYSEAIVERFYSHNSIAKKGYTIRYRPWKLIHCEFFSSKKEALNREKELKGGKGREWIRNKLIPQMIQIGFISA